MFEDNGEAYRALPTIERDLLGSLLSTDGGLLQELTPHLRDSASAQLIVDKELAVLQENNPSVAAALRGTVEGICEMLDGRIKSEQKDGLFRAAAYLNGFLLFNILALQLRRDHRS